MKIIRLIASKRGQTEEYIDLNEDLHINIYQTIKAFIKSLLILTSDNPKKNFLIKKVPYIYYKTLISVELYNKEFSCNGDLTSRLTTNTFSIKNLSSFVLKTIIEKEPRELVLPLFIDYTNKSKKIKEKTNIEDINKYFLNSNTSIGAYWLNKNKDKNKIKRFLSIIENIFNVKIKPQIKSIYIRNKDAYVDKSYVELILNIYCRGNILNPYLTTTKELIGIVILPSSLRSVPEIKDIYPNIQFLYY